MRTWTVACVVGLIARAAPIAGCGCKDRCLSSFYVDAKIPGQPTQLSNAYVTFCFENACASATLGSPPAAGAMYFDGPQLTVAVAVGLAQDGATEITLSPVADGSGQVPAFHDGDAFSVMIVDASGATLLDANGSAHYEHMDDCYSGCTVGSVDL